MDKEVLTDGLKGGLELASENILRGYTDELAYEGLVQHAYVTDPDTGETLVIEVNLLLIRAKDRDRFRRFMGLRKMPLQEIKKMMEERDNER